MSERLEDVLKKIKPYVLGWINGASGIISGSGTPGKLAKFVGAQTIGDSIVTEAGPALTVESPGGNHTTLILKSTGDHYIAVNWRNVGREYIWQLVPSTDAPANRLRLFDLNANAERVTLLTGGNLGIGVANPAAKLHVGAGDVLIDNNLSYRAKDTAGNNQAILKVSSGNRVQFGSLAPFSSNGQVEFYEAGTLGGTLDGNRDWLMERSVVIDNGAINTGSLSVAALRFGGTSSGEGVLSKRSSGGPQNGLELYTNSSPRLTVLSAGNVGVGTQAPEAKLHVGSGEFLLDFTRNVQFKNSGAGITSVLRLDTNDILKVGTLAAVPSIKGDIEFYVGGTLAGSFNTSRVFNAQNGIIIAANGLSIVGNVLLGASADQAGGSRILAMQNAATTPSGTPSGGGVLYAESGALKWKGSGGTVTVVAPA